MIVSDGKVIAIHTVNVDGTTIKGDGVKQPLSIDKSKLPQYSVVAGNSNIAVSESVHDNIVTFSLSAAGGGSGSKTYEPADEYVVVNNVNSTIGLAKDFVNSASSGYSALQVIQNNSATWERGTTYEPGENISITDENVISGRDWTSELNTKVNADSFNTWSAGVESSAANLSAAIDGLPKPKYYDDVSATVAENSANWDSVYYTVDSYSAGWNEVSAKVDKTLFETWSTSVETSAAQMSAYIKSQEEYWNNSSYNVISTTPKLLKVETKYDGKTRETTFNLSATEPKSYSAGDGISISDDNGIAVKNDGETIKLNDKNQLYTDFKTLSADNGLTNDAGIIKIDTSSLSANTQYVATVNDAGNFAWVSATSGTIYSAGNWIDSNEIRNGIIAVSGQKTLKTQLPLYFSADATDQNTVWICYDDTEKEKTAKAILIANGFKGGTYYDNGAGISATIPASDINAEYTFHFARQMGVQININAKFIAHNSAKDMIGKVGFGAVSVSGKAITNEITYSMIGALGEQYYAASTIARVAAENFPEDGIDLSFKFLGDTDFLEKIQNPCISLHEIVDEA